MVKNLKGVINLKRGAIFDMDGTLFDTEKLYRLAWIETADTFGVERKPEIAAEMSGRSVEKILVTIPQFFPEVDANEYFKRVVTRVRKEIEEKLEIKQGVVEILNFFKENKIPMAIASSSETEDIKNNIKRTGISQFFDEIVGGDQVQNGKPAPDIFILAAKKINLQPEDCYVFEDSANGIRAAHAANCVPIMVVDQAPPLPDIRKICAGIFSSMENALDAIKNGKI